MITFDKLIEEILNKGYQVNRNFKVPKDIPYLKFGFEEINLTVNNTVSVIFYRVGFNESLIMATIITKNDEFSFDPYSLVENITDKIIQQTFNKYGITESK